MEAKEGTQVYLEGVSGDVASVDFGDRLARNGVIRSPSRLWSSYAP